MLKNKLENLLTFFINIFGISEKFSSPCQLNKQPKKSHTKIKELTPKTVPQFC